MPLVLETNVPVQSLRMLRDDTDIGFVVVLAIEVRDSLPFHVGLADKNEHLECLRLVANAARCREQKGCEESKHPQ